MSNIDMGQMITAEDKAAAEEARSAAEARAYLAETDWYVTREIETGAPVPAEISQRRAEAREAAG